MFRFFRRWRPLLDDDAAVAILVKLNSLLGKVNRMTETLSQFGAKFQAALDKYTEDNAALASGLSGVQTDLAALRQEVADLQGSATDRTRTKSLRRVLGSLMLSETPQHAAKAGER